MKLSVIIPTCNRAQILPRAINSILSQPIKNYEIIIIDDASTDETKRIVKAFKNKKIKYFKHRKNQGFLAARNTGIKKATGDWLCFLDSDDQYLPQGLKIINQQIQKVKSNIDVVLFMISVQFPKGKQETWGYSPKKTWQAYQPAYEGIVLKKNIRVDMHRCLKKKVAQANLFQAWNPGLETLYYANLAKKGHQFLYLNQKVVKVYIGHSDQISHNKFKKWPQAFAKVYQQLINQHKQVFNQNQSKLFDNYIIIAKCLITAKNPVFLYWLLKAFLLQPKRFAALAHR